MSYTHLGEITTKLFLICVSRQVIRVQLCKSSEVDGMIDVDVFYRRPPVPIQPKIRLTMHMMMHQSDGPTFESIK